MSRYETRRALAAKVAARPTGVLARQTRTHGTEKVVDLHELRRAVETLEGISLRGYQNQPRYADVSKAIRAARGATARARNLLRDTLQDTTPTEKENS